MSACRVADGLPAAWALPANADRGRTHIARRVHMAFCHNDHRSVAGDARHSLLAHSRTSCSELSTQKSADPQPRSVAQGHAVPIRLSRRELLRPGFCADNALGCSPKPGFLNAPRNASSSAVTSTLIAYNCSWSRRMAPHGLVRLPVLRTPSRISGNWSRRWLLPAGNSKSYSSPISRTQRSGRSRGLNTEPGVPSLFFVRRMPTTQRPGSDTMPKPPTDRE
jgi:hypothetical protein